GRHRVEVRAMSIGPRPWAVAAPLALATFAVLSLATAISPISRDKIIAISKSGVGYSYHWSHGRWQGGGVVNPGVCKGSCPNCSHSGANGADCSGFVAKAWALSG